MNCQFCGKECKNNNSLTNHSQRCKENPNRKIAGIATDPESWKSRKTNTNQYIKARELGLPDPEVTDEARRKMSEQRAGKSLSDEHKQSIADAVNAKVAEGGWHVSLAKDLHYNYNGVDLHGSWELAYAKYLDLEEIRWERCKKRFPYQFDGKTRHYMPDFYLPDTDEYVEIKGFETDKDRAKWDQFSHKLIVLKEVDLRRLSII